MLRQVLYTQSSRLHSLEYLYSRCLAQSADMQATRLAVSRTKAVAQLVVCLLISHDALGSSAYTT